MTQESLSEQRREAPLSFNKNVQQQVWTKAFARRKNTLGLLEGKTALITGVDSNIGIATAKEFVNEGAHVLITARSKSALTAALTVKGKNVIGLKVDVSNPADLNILVEQIQWDMGKLDILFANADAAEFFSQRTQQTRHITLTLKACCSQFRRRSLCCVMVPLSS
jgi:NAD(P)-dependent dehydrogenase (short-subunit alcohol dehydrogenase family)